MRISPVDEDAGGLLEEQVGRDPTPNEDENKTGCAVGESTPPRLAERFGGVPVPCPDVGDEAEPSEHPAVFTHQGTSQGSGVWGGGPRAVLTLRLNPAGNRQANRPTYCH